MRESGPPEYTEAFLVCFETEKESCIVVVGIGEAKQPPSFPIMEYCHPQYIYRAATPYDF
jgi:hypothetical protein